MLSRLCSRFPGAVLTGDLATIGGTTALSTSCSAKPGSTPIQLTVKFARIPSAQRAEHPPEPKGLAGPKQTAWQGASASACADLVYATYSSGSAVTSEAQAAQTTSAADNTNPTSNTNSLYEAIHNAASAPVAPAAAGTALTPQVPKSPQDAVTVLKNYRKELAGYGLGGKATPVAGTATVSKTSPRNSWGPWGKSSQRVLQQKRMSC